MTLPLAILALSSGAARAQAPTGSGLDAHGFRLAAHDADPRDPLVVARPGAFDAQSWFVGGVFEYASQPLVFADGAGTTTVELDDLVAANLSAGYAPAERLRLDLSVPLYLAATGASESFGAALGDVRASGMIQLVRPGRGERLGTAIVTNLDLPTGRPEAWLGQTGLAGGIGLAMTWEGERLTLAGTAGSQLRPNTPLEERPAPTRGGDAFVWGASVGYLVAEQTGLSAELHGEVAVDDDVRKAIGIPAELMLSMRAVRDDGGFLTAGLGAGLTRGAGASPLRVVVGGGFGASGEKRPGDIDGDGIDDFADHCPATPETVNGFQDGDGCRDEPPELVFRAVAPDGTVSGDAALVVAGPRAAAGTGSVRLDGDALTVDSQWRGTAALGSCLRGEKVAQVKLWGGSTVVDIPLEPHRTGTVHVDVRDPDGRFLPATVRFRSAEPACSPSEATIAGEANQVAVGPGMHFVFVTSEGFGVQQRNFTLEEGAETTLDIVLEPAMAQLTTDETGRQVIAIQDKVYFETGRAVLQQRSHELLDEVASVIRSSDVPMLEIAGHTDSQGPDERNLELSRARAEAVKAYLVGVGIEGERLRAVGYGETRPLTENGTAAGRAQNRRVEFVVVEP